MVFEKVLKKYVLYYCQLKFGHGAKKTFLVRIKVIKTPECWQYGATKQTVQYLYAQYQNLRKQRKILMHKLEKKDIKW